MCAEPDQVAADAGQLGHDHADALGTDGGGLAEQLLHRQRVAQVVAERAQVVHAVGERDRLVVGQPLEVLLEAGVEVAHVGVAVADHLALDPQHQPQHAVGAGVLGAHVQLHQRPLGGVGHLQEPFPVGVRLGGAGDVLVKHRRLGQSGAPRGTAASGWKVPRSVNLTGSPNDM